MPILHLFLAALAILFAILGLADIGFGGLPAVVFWILAAFCLVGALTLRSSPPFRGLRQRDP